VVALIVRMRFLYAVVVGHDVGTVARLFNRFLALQGG